MRGLAAPRLAPSWGHEEAEQSSRVTAPRKKGLGVRAWLSVDHSGQASVVEAGKHAIMRRTGLPARDLRILDPMLSYPSTVLGRERAIVINLEHIKAIITAQEVLLLDARGPAVAPFVEELQRRLRQHRSCSRDGEEELHSHDAVWTKNAAKEQSSRFEGLPPSNLRVFQNADVRGKEDGSVTPAAMSDGPKVLPFEFIALETCLEAACRCLENESMTLEEEAHPALDKLTTKISTLNLECVRQIKSRLVAITGRVQKVRDELEHLLDDDEDMAEMYLTDKLLRQGLYESPSPQLNDNASSELLDNDSVPTATLEVNESSYNPSDVRDQHHFISGSTMLIGSGHGTHTSSTHGSNKCLVQDLEMLLEAYFVQIDGTLNTLSALREYVDDTEDYINITLDDKQNHLLQMGVMLTTATLIVSAFVVLVGIFGMNIQIELFDKNKSGMTEFLWTVGGGAVGGIILFMVAVSWCKHRRLLE